MILKPDAMKRNFLIWTFAAVMAVLTSCGKESFDDSKIWDAIEDLKTRITALEKKVADNVSALQSMVSLGSISSFDIDAETGKGVITLVGGKTISVDMTLKGYSLVSVIQDKDGTYYWAICRDGVSVPLEIEGKKVPVTMNLTPALKISENKEWLISIDGGKTWVDTGIAYQTGSGEESAPEFFSKVEEKDGYLVLTLPDGKEIAVEIVGEAEFKAAAETLWFSRIEMEKSVALEMVNVREYTITEKPEGWKARIDDSYLYVTSPDDFSCYPESGVVKVLALFEGGNSPEILSIDVVREPMFVLSKENDNVSVVMSEHTGEDFTGYVLKAWNKGGYDLESAVMWLNANAGSLSPYEGNKTYAIADLVEDYSEDQTYVIIAVPYLPAALVAQGKMSYDMSDVQSVSYKKSVWKISDLKYDSATLDVSVDADKYYGGFMALETWNNYGRNNVLEMLSYGGGTICTGQTYSGPVDAFPSGSGSGKIVPATEYVVWYVPFKESGEYVADDILTYTFVTPDISSDSSLKAPSYEIKKVTVSGFMAETTPISGAYKTYAAAINAAAMPESDIEVAKYLIRNGTVSEGAALNTLEVSSYSAEDVVYFVAVSVTEDGHFGAIAKQEVEINELVYTEEVSVTASVKEYGLGSVTMNVEFTGNPVSITYMAASYTYYDDATIQRLMALGQMGDATTVEVSKITDGSLFIDKLINGTEYTFYAVVRNADEEASALFKLPFTPTVDIDYILEESADYTYGMPQFSGQWKNSDTYVLNVTKPSTCTRYWLFKGDSEYFSGVDPYGDSDKLITGQLTGTTIHESSVSGVAYSPMHKASRFYTVWLDDKGHYHAIYEFNPNE